MRHHFVDNDDDNYDNDDENICGIVYTIDDLAYNSIVENDDIVTNYISTKALNKQHPQPTVN